MGPNLIPEAFLELEQAGRFDYWGQPYASLSSADRAAMLPVRMPAVLWWNSIEWDRGSAEIAAFCGDGQLRPGLIPFAGDGMGNHFCWYPRWQEGPEPPVVFFVHDEPESGLFARDFAECLVRCMLQSFAAYEPEGGPAAPELWRAHRAIVDPYLAPAHRLRLDAASADPDACAAAEAALAEEIGERTLIGALAPVSFNDDAILGYAGQAGLLRRYDRSVAFYDELVNGEGYREYADALEAVTAARDARRAASDG